MDCNKSTDFYVPNLQKFVEDYRMVHIATTSLKEACEKLIKSGFSKQLQSISAEKD